MDPFRAPDAPGGGALVLGAEAHRRLVYGAAGATKISIDEIDERIIAAVVPDNIAWWQSWMFGVGPLAVAALVLAGALVWTWRRRGPLRAAGAQWVFT